LTVETPRSTPSAVIDLHLHTTVSDGRCSPRQLVDRVAAAGVRIMAVTDHDTTAAVDEVRAYASTCGIRSIPGIEITAVEDERDVHVLGYFLDPAHDELQAFLAVQRGRRLERIEQIGERLAQLGMPLDLAPLVEQGRRQTGRSLGRPLVAHAMIAAGHVASTREAFDRWLGRGMPAFVARTGASPEAVIRVVHRAGGLVSLAHPGRTLIDARIPALKHAGLDAVEAYHTDHDPANVERYLRIARSLDLLVTGGSDFHGDPARAFEPGSTALPSTEWERLEAASQRHVSR
jgi:predicted metal-dependent phosphoesterase TrpH